MQLQNNNSVKDQDGNSTKQLLYDGFPPSELIALKQYYEKMYRDANGCRSKKQLDAMDISERIGKILDSIAEAII